MAQQIKGFFSYELSTHKLPIGWIQEAITHQVTIFITVKRKWNSNKYKQPCAKAIYFFHSLDYNFQNWSKWNFLHCNKTKFFTANKKLIAFRSFYTHSLETNII